MSYELKLELKADAPKEKILITLEEQFKDFDFCIRFDTFDSGIIAVYSSMASEQYASLYQCLYYVAYQYGKRMIDLSRLEYLPYYYHDDSLNLIVDQLSRMYYGDTEFVYLIDKDGYEKVDISEFANNDFDNFIKQHGKDKIYDYALDCTEVETHDYFTLIQNVEYGFKILKEFMLKCKDF